MEDLQSRHQKEQKDLQGRITQKKKNATKKTRKGVNDECERLQRELLDRQRAETDALSDPCKNHDRGSLYIEEEQRQEESIFPLHNSTTDVRHAGLVQLQPESPITKQPSKRPNRQKIRLARRAAEQEAQVAQAAEEAANLPDLRKQEIAEMQKHFHRLSLQEIPIRPDGHCMYSAISMLLQNTASNEHESKTGDLLPYQAVRVEAARYISEHPTEFEPFLEEPIERYTNKIKNTAEWGGQLELQAIARAYGIDINVLQADGRIEKIESGHESEVEPIWLTYYRHSFGLGEHYNALKKTIGER